MQRYIVVRLFQGVVVLFGVTVVTFVLVQLTGNPAVAYLGTDATPAAVEQMREQLGMNSPIYVQYWRYVERLAHGDFGVSAVYDQPALPLITERLPATLELAMAALLVNFLWSFPLGVLSAIKRDSLLDRLTAVFVFGSQAMPVFWSGILAILIFAVKLHWFPTSGSGGISHLVMPAFILGTHTAAYQTRLLRSSMLDILDQDFIRTARAKGVGERAVVIRHALRNSLMTLSTVTGVQFAALMSGAVVTEAVFVWPGVGSIAAQAIQNADISLVMAATFVFAVIVWFLNLIVDLSYVLIDPRVKLTS